MSEYQDMTAVQLRSELKLKGLSGLSKYKKQDLLNILTHSHILQEKLEKPTQKRVNTFQDALRVFADSNGKYIIPKRGTEEHSQVLAIQEKIKADLERKTSELPKKGAVKEKVAKIQAPVVQEEKPSKSKKSDVKPLAKTSKKPEAEVVIEPVKKAPRKRVAKVVEPEESLDDYDADNE